MEQEDREVNATRRAVAGHTGDTEGEPSKGRASDVDGRMAHVRADTVKALTDMAEALREMERTRRSRRTC